jgi:hypothetical protein
VLDREIGFELAVLTLCFGDARDPKCNAERASRRQQRRRSMTSAEKRAVVWEVTTLMRYRS